MSTRPETPGSSRRHGKRKLKSPGFKSADAKKSNVVITKSCRSLVDICAEVVASSVPFQVVEDRFTPIPEPVQLRIIYWSFPRNEEEIKIYSSVTSNNNLPADSIRYNGSFSGGSEFQSGAKQQFAKAVKLLDEGHVNDVLQVGFHLSGTVVGYSSKSTSSELDLFDDAKIYRISINFDRCKITSVSCTCGNRDIFWCQHVVALSLYRIRKPDDIRYRIPISETLAHLSKAQLQKLCMYTIAAHHRDVLPTCQKLVDSLLSPESRISSIGGFPDPTAGAAKDDENCYFIDETQVQEQVKFYLSQGGYYNSTKQLTCMFSKIREMLRARDSNGPRMLRLITQEFIADPKLKIWHTQGNVMTEKARLLWDCLGYMWLLVVFNPSCSLPNREVWKQCLDDWHLKPECPLENPDLHPQDNQEDERRTVFSKALDACCYTWDDSHLQSLLGLVTLKNDCSPSCKSCDMRMWDEPLPIATCRVDTLRSNGYKKECITLALAVIRNLRKRQRRKMSKHRREECAVEHVSSWVGHTSEPILTLIDLLLEVSEDRNSSGKYIHVPVDHQKSGSQDEESFLCLAFEVALLGLSQHRLLPSGLYAQERLCRSEESIISKLSTANTDSRIIRTIVSVTKSLLRGCNNGLAEEIHSESVPMQILCKYLFDMLVNIEKELAYKVGVLGLRLPVTDNTPTTDETESLLFNAEHTRWYTLGTFQSRQVELALAMFSAANENMPFIKMVLDAVQCHLKSASHLFSLAQDIFKKSNAIEGTRNRTLLNVAFELGLQLLRITLQATSWRRTEMVNWQISCATDVGAGALISMMQSWSNFLTPKEATSIFATAVISSNTPMRLNLDFTQLEELKKCARTLVLQCTRQDPANCAIYALQFCETDHTAFEAAYQIVLDASASNDLSASQLFAVARFMERRMHRVRAYRLSIIALKLLKIGANQETHPSIADVHWAVAISFQLGKTEITATLRQVLLSVQCANVLSDILRRCTVTQPMPVDSHGHGSSAKRVKSPNSSRFLNVSQPPLNELLEATLTSYVASIHSRLQHISPRHYGDFLTLLHKARETFLLAENGRVRFRQLMDQLKHSYRGKKKLMQLIRETIG